MYSCQWNSNSQLRSVTCHRGSHSVTCHLTQVNTPHLNPSQTGRYSINQPWRDGRLNWPRWLVTYRDRLPTCRQSPIQSTNWAQCRLTALLEANVPTTTIHCHPIPLHDSLLVRCIVKCNQVWSMWNFLRKWLTITKCYHNTTGSISITYYTY